MSLQFKTKEVKMLVTRMSHPKRKTTTISPVVPQGATDHQETKENGSLPQKPPVNKQMKMPKFSLIVSHF